MLRVVGKMWKRKEARHLWLALLLEIAWVHCGLLSVERNQDHGDNVGFRSEGVGWNEMRTIRKRMLRKVTKLYSGD
jgi:hypothetical protein